MSSILKFVPRKIRKTIYKIASSYFARSPKHLLKKDRLFTWYTCISLACKMYADRDVACEIAQKAKKLVHPKELHDLEITIASHLEWKLMWVNKHLPLPSP